MPFFVIHLSNLKLEQFKHFSQDSSVKSNSLQRMTQHTKCRKRSTAKETIAWGTTSKQHQQRSFYGLCRPPSATVQISGWLKNQNLIVQRNVFQFLHRMPLVASLAIWFAGQAADSMKWQSAHDLVLAVVSLMMDEMRLFQYAMTVSDDSLNKQKTASFSEGSFLWLRCSYQSVMRNGWHRPHCQDY